MRWAAAMRAASMAADLVFSFINCLVSVIRLSIDAQLFPFGPAQSQEDPIQSVHMNLRLVKVVGERLA